MLKGTHHSTETRIKISEKQKRRCLNPEVKAKMREAMKGKMVGPANTQWKGGRQKHSEGYIQIWSPSHPRADTKRLVFEHMLVWEKAQGRSLPFNWTIHHINGIRDDNRPGNLLACPKGNHHYALLLQSLRTRIRALEAENRRLKLQGKLWD